MALAAGLAAGLVLAGAARADDGLSIVAGADCTVCHVMPTLPKPARTASCTGCHIWIRQVAASPNARAAAMKVFPRWERYERNVHSYLVVPDLPSAFARLEPAWIRAYLRDPSDQRPSLDETMVRLGLSGAQIDAIAEWAGAQQTPVPPTPAPRPELVATGRALFETRGCVACHTFGGLTTGPGVAMAPDLQHARERMSDDRIVAWIEDPAAISPTATMPDPGLTREEAIAVRDFLVLADPRARPARPPVGDIPAVSTRVSFAEVDDRILSKICAHCHMDPAQNEDRAGPGNAGGFGWPATGIELQTYAGVRAHGPAILAAVQRRRTEAARDRVAPGEAPIALERPALPGMPLGLPPLPDEDIALLRAWVEQGMPE